MRRSLFVIGLLSAAVLALGALTSSATAGCVLECKARCVGPNTVELTWNTICTEASCRVTSTIISRSCFPDGPWTVIAKDPTSPYIDHPITPCPTPYVYYRIEVKWECPSGVGHSSCDTGPIHCP